MFDVTIQILGAYNFHSAYMYVYILLNTLIKIYYLYNIIVILLFIIVELSDVINEALGTQKSEEWVTKPEVLKGLNKYSNDQAF